MLLRMVSARLIPQLGRLSLVNIRARCLRAKPCFRAPSTAIAMFVTDCTVVCLRPFSVHATQTAALRFGPFLRVILSKVVKARAPSNYIVSVALMP